MATDVQFLVDHLAQEVGASVVLEDARQRTIAHSCQLGPIDALRRDSILHRATPPEIIAWLRGFGIGESRSIVSIPGHDALGILPRLCAPVRHHNQLLGFVWVIDRTGSLGRDHAGAIEKAALHAGILLYEEMLADRLTRHALSHLLSPSEELRAAAAEQIVDQALLAGDQPIAIAVVQPLAAPDGHELAPGLDEALSGSTWETPAGSVLRLAYADHGVLLTRVRSCDDDAPALEIAATAREMLARRLANAGMPASRVLAAIGDPQPHLGGAITSYRQARLAIKVAAAIPAMNDVVRWSELGVFRALAQLPTREAQESALDPRVRSLLNCGDETVVSTLETYLDLAGDIKATAEALHLHRGTLYYRLEKAERIAGVDFHNGYDRLAVHLGLKLARLAGHRSPVAIGS